MSTDNTLGVSEYALEESVCSVPGPSKIFLLNGRGLVSEGDAPPEHSQIFSERVAVINRNGRPSRNADMLCDSVANQNCGLASSAAYVLYAFVPARRAAWTQMLITISPEPIQYTHRQATGG